MKIINEKKIILKNDDDSQISNKLEEVIEENCRNKLVENILNLEHMVDDDTRSLAIVAIKVFWPFGLFHDIQKNIIFQKTI